MALTEASAFKDGSIVNDDVKSDAAIAGSKINPTFTSDITINEANPSIFFNDTGNNPDYEIGNHDGVLKISDTTNSATRFAVNTDGHVDVAGRLDVGSNLRLSTSNVDSDIRSMNVTGAIRLRINNNSRLRVTNSGAEVIGNISCSGTVDGRDIATDGTKLDTLSVPITPAVEVTQRTNDFSTSSNSYQTVMSVTITPNSSSSKLLVIAGGSFQGLTDENESDNANARVKLFRGSTEIGTLSSVTGSKTGFYLVNKDTNNHGGNAVTYHLKLKRHQGNAQTRVHKGASLQVQEII